MLKIYLAANFEQRFRLRNLAAKMRSLGVLVTSRWIHVAKLAMERTLAEQVEAARNDEKDVRSADVLVLFTEDGRTARGGREVELGMAIALGTRVWLVGPALNVFHRHPTVQFCFGSSLQLLHYLRSQCPELQSSHTSPSTEFAPRLRMTRERDFVSSPGEPFHSVPTRTTQRKKGRGRT